MSIVIIFDTIDNRHTWKIHRLSTHIVCRFFFFLYCVDGPRMLFLAWMFFLLFLFHSSPLLSLFVDQKSQSCQDRSSFFLSYYCSLWQGTTLARLLSSKRKLDYFSLLYIGLFDSFRIDSFISLESMWSSDSLIFYSQIHGFLSLR